MAQFDSNSQAADSLWRGALERIPTILGRLAYVAGLRDPVSNSYSHPKLSRTLGAEEADRTIRQRHYRVFSDWLALGLEDQKSDLVSFLDGEGLPPEKFRPQDLIPPQAREVERRLYLTDLGTLLELLKAGRRAVSPEK